MSNIGAAAQAASTGPVRHTVHVGPLVRIAIPDGATSGSYPTGNGDERVPYLQFSRTVPGGLVNMFVAGGDLSLRGKTITAQATVMMKELDDGRTYMYVDFVPAADDTHATHRLLVMPRDQSEWDPNIHTVIETPEPVRGVIVFGPPKPVKERPVKADAETASADA